MLSIAIIFCTFATTMNIDFYNDLEKACEVLGSGGVILYPTDTIWGIGCDARCSKAIRRIYQIKQRDDSKALLLLVADEKMLRDYVGEIPDQVLEIIRTSQRPTSVIFPHPSGIAREVLADDGSVGIRITYEAFSSELCRRFGSPIVSTSANVSGNAFPHSYADISEEIRRAVDYIVDYRRVDSAACRASRIVKLSDNNTITIIRE